MVQNEPSSMNFDKVRKSRHLVKVNEFKEKIKAFKKKPRNQGKFMKTDFESLMKNQSEMIKEGPKSKIIKNRSFQKQLKEAGNKEMTFNLYKKQANPDHSSKFNLTGEIKFTSKREQKRETSQGNQSGKQSYQSNKDSKKQLKTVNLYNTLIGGEEKAAKGPVQLLKTRSKNSSFVKNKMSSFNEPQKKNFEIKLYKGGEMRRANLKIKMRRARIC